MSQATLEKSANVTATPSTPAPAKEAEHKPEFGKGRFSAEAERIYGEIIAVFRLAPVVAEKIAKQAASDVGAILANAPASIKVSSINKDGKTTISDTSKLKGVSITNALSVVRALQWITDAGKNGVSYGHTDWKLSAPLQEYVDGIGASK